MGRRDLLTGISQGMTRLPAGCRVGATAAYGAGCPEMGIGGGASKAHRRSVTTHQTCRTVSPGDTGLRATQVTVFRTASRRKPWKRWRWNARRTERKKTIGKSVRFRHRLKVILTANTDQMLKQLGNLNPQQFMSGSQRGNDGK